MLQKISPRVYCWFEIHGEARNEPYPWNSYLIHVEDENILALVDPLPMSPEEVQEIEALGTPTHILLTCEYHLRESESYKEKWGCKIFANEVELERYQVPIDGTFQDGERLWRLIDLIYIPDVKFPDTALLVREGGGVLIVGDLLAGGRKDQGISEGELGVCGPEYVPDLGKARHSLGKLLDYSFEVMCFGHGSPVWDAPKAKLEQYLGCDEIWENLEEIKRNSPSPQIQNGRKRSEGINPESVASTIQCSRGFE